MNVRYELGNTSDEATMAYFKVMFLRFGPCLKIRSLPLFSEPVTAQTRM
jgi:hypothetical protein